MPIRSMPLRASALAAALAVVAAECDVCHLHYFHKVRRFVSFFAFSPREPLVGT